VSTVFTAGRSFRRLLILSVLLSLAGAGLSCRRDAETGQRARSANQPNATPAPPPPASSLPREELIRQFHLLWYNSGGWAQNRWLGVPTQQNPMDVWMLQEIIFATKPDFIVECGAYHGGSAALWAMLLEQVSRDGRVISIDIEDRMAEARKLPVVQRKVEYIVGSSTAPDVVAKVKARVRGKKSLVILDSVHTKQHVLNELNAYWDIVPVGGYINVQDTNVNGNPVLPDWGPGPMEAVHEFVAKSGRFRIDTSQERLLLTLHPNGFLQRTK
jgi:cephalosporin hydroxylase